MRKGKVYYNDMVAGELAEQEQGGYRFEYDAMYYNNSLLPPISVTLPKNKTVHESDILFPFFFNMLSEGANRQLQCQLLKVDEDDDFGLLLQTADAESIGAITVKPIT
jgi:HipA-like protein